MAIKPIVIAPDPRLKQKSLPVEKVDAEVQQLMEDMLDTMYNAHGIGLAAVQIGVMKRVIVVDVEHNDDHQPGRPIAMANPEIVESDAELSSYNEGCLSFPQQYSEVERPKSITVKYLDHEGKPQTLKADGLLATCIQHEIDHTDGINFVDHISKLKREMIIKKLDKGKKRGDYDHIYQPHAHGHHHHDHDHEHVHYHDGVPCKGHH